MPTLDYTPSNTPPVGIALGSSAQSNGAPGAVPLDLVPTGIGPVALAVPSGAPSNVPPGVVALNLAASNAAPVAVAFANQAPTGAGPGAITMADRTPASDQPTAIPFAASAGTAAVPQQVNPPAVTAALSDQNMHTAALQFTGKLSLNQIFGFYRAPAAGVIRGVQLSAQTPPTGSDAVIELVDSDGNLLGRSATLPAGQAYANVNFATPLPVLLGAIVRAKITQIGSGTAGGYLTVNLVVQLS